MREDRVSLSGLPRATKRRVWKAIQQDAPNLAKVLTDKGYQTLLDRFDGKAWVAFADLPESARAALREAQEA